MPGMKLDAIGERPTNENKIASPAIGAEEHTCWTTNMHFSRYKIFNIFNVASVLQNARIHVDASGTRPNQEESLPPVSIRRCLHCGHL